MLAQPYGYPSILSSYAFACPSGNAMGPPSDATGATNDVACASNLETATIGQWVCEHRDAYIAGMVRFRRVVAGSDINHWWDNGANAIAFSRGDKGFVAINRESAALTASIPTGLAAGTYCDVLTGGRNGTVCAGTSVLVDATGSVQITLASNSAVAIHTGTRL
jgi:alpha-amylase